MRHTTLHPAPSPTPKRALATTLHPYTLLTLSNPLRGWTSESWAEPRKTVKKRFTDPGPGTVFHSAPPSAREGPGADLGVVRAAQDPGSRRQDLAAVVVQLLGVEHLQGERSGQGTRGKGGRAHGEEEHRGERLIVDVMQGTPTP